jgi:hypothetical protein
MKTKTRALSEAFARFQESKQWCDIIDFTKHNHDVEVVCEFERIFNPGEYNKYTCILKLAMPPYSLGSQKLLFRMELNTPEELDEMVVELTSQDYYKEDPERWVEIIKEASRYVTIK